LEERMLPSSPTFFTWEVGNTNIGPGTKVRSLIRLAAQSYEVAKEDPMDLIPRSMENPFIRFARGNAAPVISDAWDIISGHNYVGDPTGFFDGWDEDSVLDNFKQMGTEVILPDIMPIWIQATLLEGGTIPERITRAVSEFFGGRAYELNWKAQAAKVARDAGYGEYEDLNAHTKILIDELMVERGFDPERYKFKKGPLHKKRDDITEKFLSDVQDIADKMLSGGVETKAFHTRGAKARYNTIRKKRIDELYGSKWDEEKERLVGGVYDDIYDMDKEREVPEEGTKEHRIWQYYKIFDDSTNPDGTVDWDKQEELENRFWASLKGDEYVDEILANIRNIEQKYPKEMRNFVDAGRYASIKEVNLGGHSSTYYNLDRHPAVIEYLMKKSGKRRDQVEDYLELTYTDRDAERKEEPGRSIHDAFERASAPRGVLHELKDDFVRGAGDEWIWAMLDSGRKYQGSDAILFGRRAEDRRGIFKAIERGDLIKPEIDYDTLYRDILKSR